jgi:hypothetical protein
MKHLFKAIADFQQEVPVIHKGTQGYGYSYSDLPAIFKVINPLLQKHGLGFTQLINSVNEVNYLETLIFHVESGEKIGASTMIPQVALKGMNDYQSFGSGITYYRRYALASALGLVTDKDTDASGEQVKHEPKKQPINDERFVKALQAIKEGKAKKDDLLKFELTAEQVAMFKVHNI